MMEIDKKLLKQGAEGKIWEGTFQGRRCIGKERFPKRYRHPDLDERITKERMRGELRGILRSKAIGIRTPAVYFVDGKQNLIVMEYIEGVDTVNVEIGLLLQKGGEEDKLKMMAKRLGITIGKLHSAGIIHGDLTTSNILIDKQSQEQLALIDFGLSKMEHSAEDKGVDLYVLERALSSTFSNIPWFFELLLQSYRDSYKDGEEVFIKLEEIRLRGRKRTMVG